MTQRSYLVCSNKAKASYGGTEYLGIRCTCTKHFFYALPLANEEVSAYQSWPLGAQEGRRLLGDFFVSDSSCKLPGARLGLSKDDGPLPLPRDLVNWIINGAQGPVPPRRVSLKTDCKRMIADELSRLASEARAKSFLVPAYKALMHTLLWMWTADAYDDYDEEIVRDGSKYSFERLRHTEEAHKKFMKGSGVGGLIHEHAVPRRRLVQHMLETEMDAAAIAMFLEVYCFGVIVTADQDREVLRGPIKSAMPRNWQFGSAADPLARYRDVLVVHDAGKCPECSRDVSAA